MGSIVFAILSSLHLPSFQNTVASSPFQPVPVNTVSTLVQSSTQSLSGKKKVILGVVFKPFIRYTEHFHGICPPNGLYPKYQFMSCKWWNRKSPIVQKVKEGKVNLAKDQECWVLTDGSEKDGKVEYG